MGIRSTIHLFLREWRFARGDCHKSYWRAFLWARGTTAQARRLLQGGQRRQWVREEHDE